MKLLENDDNEIFLLLTRKNVLFILDLKTETINIKKKFTFNESFSSILVQTDACDNFKIFLTTNKGRLVS